MATTESDFVRKEPCPKCGSRNNLARYSDGHAYCFSFGCEYYEPGEKSDVTETDAPEERRSKDLISIGEFAEWAGRHITLESAQKWGFTRSEMGGEPVRIFNYRNEAGQIIAQKV